MDDQKCRVRSKSGRSSTTFYADPEITTTPTKPFDLPGGISV